MKKDPSIEAFETYMKRGKSSTIEHGRHMMKADNELQLFMNIENRINSQKKSDEDKPSDKTSEEHFSEDKRI